MNKSMLKKGLLTICFWGIATAYAQTQKEKALATTATSFANNEWPDKAEVTKLNGLSSAAAVKYIAKKAGLISQSQANALKDDKIISPYDEPLTDILDLKPGWILGVVENEKIVHVMVSLGNSAAAGTGNMAKIGLGSNGVWQIVDLRLIKSRQGVLTLKNKEIQIVYKSADQILNTNSQAVEKSEIQLNSSDNFKRDMQKKAQADNNRQGNAAISQPLDEMPERDNNGKADDRPIENIDLSPAERAISSANHNNWVKAFDFAANTRKLAFNDLAKIKQLSAFDAVKFIAMQANIVSQEESDQIDNARMISPADKTFINFKDVDNGELIGFVKNGRVVHVMIAGSYGDAFGINNLQAIATGRNGVWEKVKLNIAVLASSGFSLVRKNAIDIKKTAANVATNSSNNSRDSRSSQSNNAKKNRRYSTTLSSLPPDDDDNANAATNSNNNKNNNNRRLSTKLSPLPADDDNENEANNSNNNNNNNRRTSTKLSPLPADDDNENEANNSNNNNNNNRRTSTKLSPLPADDDNENAATNSNNSKNNNNRRTSTKLSPLPADDDNENEANNSNNNKNNNRRPITKLSPLPADGEGNYPLPQPPPKPTTQKINNRNENLYDTPDSKFGDEPEKPAAKKGRSSASSSQSNQNYNNGYSDAPPERQDGDAQDGSGRFPPPPPPQKKNSNKSKSTSSNGYSDGPPEKQYGDVPDGSGRFPPPPPPQQRSSSNNKNNNNGYSDGPPEKQYGDVPDGSGKFPPPAPPQQRSNNNNKNTNGYGQTPPDLNNPSSGYSNEGISFNPLMDIQNTGKYTVKDWSSYGDPANPNPALNQFAIFKQKKPANSKIMNVLQYVAAAYNFKNDHPQAEELSMPNGDLVIYDRVINLFAVYDKDGKPKEMYCPGSKEQLFNKYKLQANE